MSKFTPSKYQKEIFDFILNDTRNAVISAVAGSGKTTTLLKALDIIPDDKTVLFLAFNKSIADELSKRVPDNKKNISVKTVHSYGKSILSQKSNSELDTKKYRGLLWSLINFLKGGDESKISVFEFNEEQQKYIYEIGKLLNTKISDEHKFVSDIVSLCNLSRLHLVNFDIKPIGVGEINKLAQIHSVSNEDNESTIAWYLAKLGMHYLNTVDYTDMVTIPVLLNLKFEEYDFVFIDECQDLNTAQRTLMQRIIKPETGRFIAVGDPKQAIYAFAGADHESYQKLKQIPNTVELPLSFTYRVAPQILNLVKHINPAIIAHTKNKPGKVIDDASYKDIVDGDMVLCRNTFPIVALCIKLLGEGKKSFIVGSDIGESLTKMISSCKREREEFNMNNVLCRLIKEKEKMVEKIVTNHNMKKNEALEDSQVIIFSEKIQVIEALSNGIDDPNVVIEKIKMIFSDKEKDGIRLSTIHKSKGLEADRVFIIHEDLIPSKYAILPWQIEQERNLEYVAYTRAKTVLGFVKDFDAFKGHKSRQINSSEIKVSKHVGVVGGKMFLKLKVVDRRVVNGPYGETIVFDLIDDKGNVFSKFGEIDSSYLDGNITHNRVEINSEVSFHALIKEHSEFKGSKVTKLGKISHY
jgi:DNA helicase-2/ATP-dependent DNA helicase PcrA